MEDTPRAPELPEWCYEEEEGVSDDDGESNNFGGGGERPAKKMKRRPYNEVCFCFVFIMYSFLILKLSHIQIYSQSCVKVVPFDLEFFCGYFENRLDVQSRECLE